MEELNYKSVFDKMIESVEQVKKFREDSKATLETIREIERSITKEILVQKKLCEETLQVTDQNVKIVGQKAEMLSDNLRIDSLNLTKAIEESVEKGIRTINLSVEKGIRKMQDEYATIINRVSGFEDVADKYIADANKYYNIFEKTIKNMESQTNETLKSLSEYKTGMQRIENRLEEISSTLGTPKTVKKSNENEPSLKSPDFPLSTNPFLGNPAEIKLHTAGSLNSYSIEKALEKPSFENEVDDIVRNIGLPMVLNIYEDICKSLPDRTIYSKIGNKNQGEQMRILHTVQKWVTDGKKSDLFAIMKNMSKNPQILARIERLEKLEKVDSKII